MTALGKKYPDQFQWSSTGSQRRNQTNGCNLQAWFPGTEGAQAIVDILFGKVNPSGRLSMSFPEDVGQLPLYYNHFNTGRPLNSKTHTGRFVSKYLDCSNEPLFPFGYGLSFGEASYHSLKLSDSTMNETLEAEITICNNSAYSRLETVQLYIRDHVGSAVRPVKELKNIKIPLSPYEEITVLFTITKKIFLLSKDLTFGVEPGLFTLFIGKNSAEGEAATFELL